MQSHAIKFKCGHEKALPLDETGNNLKAKIASLEALECEKCMLERLKEMEARRVEEAMVTAAMRARTR